jgi:hypothetical protein
MHSVQTEKIFKQQKAIQITVNPVGHKMQCHMITVHSTVKETTSLAIATVTSKTIQANCR